MEQQLPVLQLRSDGWHETSDGLFAVVMKVMTVEHNGVRSFRFVTQHGMKPISVEWNKADKLQLFPGALAATLLNSGYAKMPDEAALAWYASLMEPVQEPDPVEPTGGPQNTAPTAPEPAVGGNPPAAAEIPPQAPPSEPTAPAPAPAPAKAPAKKPDGKAG